LIDAVRGRAIYRDARADAGAKTLTQRAILTVAYRARER
jgi:hypothetical protein